MKTQALKAKNQERREAMARLMALLEMYEAIPDKPAEVPNQVQKARAYLEQYNKRRQLFRVVK